MKKYNVIPGFNKVLDHRAHFEKKFRVTPGCWIWTAGFYNVGYGQFKEGPKAHGAHRFSYILYCGEIPDGLFVCHKCDNRACVNPDHLFLGTHAENMADMRKKGRGANLKGSQVGNAKLTESIVLEILKSDLPQYVLRKKYGISSAQISRIKNGKRWAHMHPAAVSA